MAQVASPRKNKSNRARPSSKRSSRAVARVPKRSEWPERSPSVPIIPANIGNVGYARVMNTMTPLQRVTLERRGVESWVLGELAGQTHLPATRLFEIVGLPKATANRKTKSKQQITGSSAYAALAMMDLLAKAEQIAANSTAPEARSFDVGAWLGRWIEVPQPALGGRRPSELLATPTGAGLVLRLLGALESGSYQ